MANSKVVLGPPALLVLGAIFAASCGSSTGKRAESNDGGGSGEGSLAGATGLGGQPQGPGGQPGSAGGPLAGKGGAAAGTGGVGGDAAGSGGEAGDGGLVCIDGADCTDNPGAPCLLGLTECTAGVGACVDGDAMTDGAACPGGSCAVGICVTPLQLFNTGVDANGAALAGGSVDPHFTLLESADGTFTGPEAIVVSQIADGYWVPQSDTSQWIAPSSNQSFPGPTPCNAAGAYVYRTSFALTAQDAATLTISGLWGADNTGVDIYLNDSSLGIAAGGYAPLTAFSIDGGFVAGLNTLDFEILDSGCPNGLRVELTASTTQ